MSSPVATNGTVTRRKEFAKSRSSVNGEIEARKLLLAGVEANDAAKITGLSPTKAASIAKHIAGFGDGPYTADDAASIMGVSYRAVYHSIGKIPFGRGDENEYRVTRQALTAFAEEQLHEDGERKARYLLFLGRPLAIAAVRGRINQDRAGRLLKCLLACGAGPKSLGPYTVDQASEVLGLKPRQVSAYCQKGRIATTKFGKQYQVSRKELIRFGAKDRRSGCPVTAEKRKSA